MNKYGVDLAMMTNKMPTPYVITSCEEFLRRAFLTSLFSSFPPLQSRYRQVSDLIDGKMVAVQFLDYERGYLAIASVYEPKTWAKPAGWTLLPTEWPYGTFVAFYCVGCTHEHMRLVKERDYVYTEICTECGYSQSTDSS